MHHLTEIWSETDRRKGEKEIRKWIKIVDLQDKKALQTKNTLYSQGNREWDMNAGTMGLKQKLLRNFATEMQCCSN